MTVNGILRKVREFTSNFSFEMLFSMCVGTTLTDLYLFPFMKTFYLPQTALSILINLCLVCRLGM